MLTVGAFREIARDRYRSEKADLVWDPKLQDVIGDGMDAYLEVACSACIIGAGRNKEYAHHVLQICESSIIALTIKNYNVFASSGNGDLKSSLKRLMDPNPTLPSSHPLRGYKYPETDAWTTEQIESYHRALVKCDKDFSAVAKEVGRAA